MKVIERAILSFQENDFFSPIRTKIDYAKVLVLAARSLLLNIPGDKQQNESKLKLVVDKMSRMFFYKDTKYFSISFPLNMVISGSEVVEITTYSGKLVDNKSISAVISILNSSHFLLNPSLIDFYIEPYDIESVGVFLLEEIFQFEPSYIRYDHDPENVNGKLHPIDHIDINYSQYSTYKLGLNQTITHDYFENIQNVRTDCSFIID